MPLCHWTGKWGVCDKLFENTETRLEDKLEYQVQVDNAPCGRKVPGLILQPMVEMQSPRHRKPRGGRRESVAHPMGGCWGRDTGYCGR